LFPDNETLVIELPRADRCVLKRLVLVGWLDDGTVGVELAGADRVVDVL